MPDCIGVRLMSWFSSRSVGDGLHLEVRHHLHRVNGVDVQGIHHGDGEEVLLFRRSTTLRRWARSGIVPESFGSARYLSGV